MTWKSSNNIPDSSVRTIWSIDTNLRKFKFIELMKMKLLFTELPIIEYRCLIDAPGVLNDELFVSAIIARSLVNDLNLLIQRLNFLQSLLERRVWNKDLFFTWNGNLRFRIREMRMNIRPARKFSGYVRNISAIGSKRSRISSFEPETWEYSSSEQIDFLTFLTVGELTTGSPGGNSFTPMIGPVRPKR